MLPWEGGARAGGLLQALGGLRPAVLELLERVPAQRMAAADFASACRRALTEAHAESPE